MRYLISTSQLWLVVSIIIAIVVAMVVVTISVLIGLIVVLSVLIVMLIMVRLIHVVVVRSSISTIPTSIVYVVTMWLWLLRCHHHCTT